MPGGGSCFNFTYPFIVTQHKGHLQLQLEEVIAFFLTLLSHSTKVTYKCQGEEMLSISLILSLSHCTKVIYKCQRGEVISFLLTLSLFHSTKVIYNCS